jgi:hypothetical protein
MGVEVELTRVKQGRPRCGFSLLGSVYIITCWSFQGDFLLIYYAPLPFYLKHLFIYFPRTSKAEYLRVVDDIFIRCLVAIYYV